MKKADIASYFDAMSDYLDEHAPDVVAAHSSSINGDPDTIDDLISRLLPTEDEVTSIRIGAIAALVYARDILTGDYAPTKPDADARKVVANSIDMFLTLKYDRKEGGHE